VETKLKAAFSLFDTENTGQISEQNLIFAFQKLGYKVPLPEIRKSIKQYDLGKDGKINFEEFILIVGDKKMNDLKNHKSDYKRLKLRRS
jgi:Ca2+-binding EF-hand superfamily protein